MIMMCILRLIAWGHLSHPLSLSPGTSAEILDDTVRERIAKGRLSSAQWKETVQAAHSLLLPTTATMM
jgi:2-iminoacetate synthase ThiH